MPLGDWQFWVVSAIALCALAYLLRELLPPKLSPFRKRTSRSVKANLTIQGKTVNR